MRIFLIENVKRIKLKICQCVCWKKKRCCVTFEKCTKVAWVYKTEKSLWLESVISKAVLKKWLYWHNIIIWSCGGLTRSVLPIWEQLFDQLSETTISAIWRAHAHPVKAESTQLLLSWAKAWLSTETRVHSLLTTGPRNTTHTGSVCEEKKKGS